MGTSVSYELLSFRGGSWIIESVYDNKDVALQEAHRLLEGRHQTGVKVIEEKYDDATDKTMARIVFSRQKGEAKSRPKQRKDEKDEPKTGPAAAPAARRTEGDTTFFKHILTLILSVGGILFGVIALSYFSSMTLTPENVDHT